MRENCYNDVGNNNEENNNNNNCKLTIVILLTGHKNKKSKLSI